MNDKLDHLFSVRSDDNLYNAWRAFTPPERDALFLALWRLVRSAGYSRSDLELVLKDALSDVTEDHEPDPISEMLQKIGRELKGPQMV